MKTKNRLEMAVYGKGGIGKSTMSANLTAALAMKGRHVMQIGCDPKHDSTRLLMHGENIETVLDYIRDHDKNNERIEDVLHTGVFNVGCIEAGGPRPGVGCAGRGIISAFEFLERTKAKEAYDLIVYDVLGDVVCGGFAVPVRREYADTIFLVTSGEYMALYAANNILRGIKNFDGELYSRVAGIIYNERKITDEDNRVSRFASAVGLPILAKVPRSTAFAKAEEENRTVMEIDGYEEEKSIFSALAAKIDAGLTLHPAKPLSDELLEKVVLGTVRNEDILEVEEKPVEAFVEEKKSYSHVPALLEARDKKRMPLYGCAFTGAITAAVHLYDAIIIAHSPKACAFYTWQNISSPGRKNLFNRGIVMPSALSPNFTCTDMGQAEAVFGGSDKLREAVAEAKKQKPGAIIIVSSCVSGIIGDDIKALESDDPSCPVITIEADGVIAGDYMEGYRLCQRTLVDKIIDKGIMPLDKDQASGRMINLIGETSVSNNSALNFDILSQMLAPMGISINCRYLGDASCKEVRELKKAPLNVLADHSPDNQMLKGYLSSGYGITFSDNALPIGFYEGERFLRELGSFFGISNLAEQTIRREKALYQEKVKKLRPYLAGKKVFLTTINVNLDWLFDACEDLGVSFEWIGVLNYLHTPICISRHEKMLAVVHEEFNWQVIEEEVKRIKPDIVLSNYTSIMEKGDYVVDSVPMLMPIGFQTGVRVAARWKKLLEEAEEGEWINDKELFEKYFG